MLKVVYVRELATKCNLDKVLTFRPLGKVAKTLIFNEIEKMFPGDCLELDFTDIETCDVSFVDEIVLEVQIYLREKEKNILLFLAHFNEDIIDNLEGAIARREGKGVKIPILVQENDRLNYIGPLEPALAETFYFMSSKNEINARDIAEHTGTAINAASNRLKKLYNLRLCLREERIDINGKQHIYKIPV